MAALNISNPNNLIMREVLETNIFEFPYTDLHFPGMNTGEKILFITRESPIMLKFRTFGLATVIFFVVGLGLLLLGVLGQLGLAAGAIRMVLLLVSGISFIFGLWWIHQTYRKSVFIITTRRLTKIIYTTPFTWYQFSLGLDEIQDTGSYSSSYFEALFNLGYFVARSGAAAIKNFKIVNITFAQDLHNYVNKLLYAFKHHPDKIDAFRPFIPHMKGERRRTYLEKYPEYKTEF